jgi:hypothetical protein
MIFHDLIDQLRSSTAAAVKELFDTAIAHQSHPQDLLLVDQHGFHNEMLAKYVPPPGQPRLSPYMIGPDLIGFAEDTFFKFTHWYRTSHQEDKGEFEAKVASDPAVQEQEALLLQLELSIYLRFWESDLILKRLRQLSALCVGQPYNWLIKIPRKGGRHRVIREKIRDRVKDVCPAFYALVDANYKSQIRNAIAHSQYAIVGRHIALLNHSDDPQDFAPLRGMSFDEWYSMFHTTLLFHNELVAAFARCREEYRQRTLANENRIQIRIVLPDGQQEFRDLAVKPNSNWWVYHENLAKSST